MPRTSSNKGKKSCISAPPWKNSVLPESWYLAQKDDGHVFLIIMVYTANIRNKDQI
jgi:hypothetical protein